ncbi:TRAP transporter small permease subunit [Aquicoccus sp. SCR17]|nr:TRAP transporter small permease subunit [Carideicomes alvinocaridis]
MHVFSRLDAALGRLYHWIGTLVGISIGLFAVSISLDLVLRLFALGNLPGVQEVIEYLLFAGVFLSAPWALRIGAHVRVDLVLSSLPPGIGRALELALDFLGLVIALILIWFGFANLRFAYDIQSMQMKYYNVPEWWILTVYVISFTLIAIEFLSRMFRKPEPAAEDGEIPGGL